MLIYTDGREQYVQLYYLFFVPKYPWLAEFMWSRHIIFTRFPSKSILFSCNVPVLRNTPENQEEIEVSVNVEIKDTQMNIPYRDARERFTANTSKADIIFTLHNQPVCLWFERYKTLLCTDISAEFNLGGVMILDKVFGMLHEKYFKEKYKNAKLSLASLPSAPTIVAFSFAGLTHVMVSGKDYLIQQYSSIAEALTKKYQKSLEVHIKDLQRKYAEIKSLLERQNEDSSPAHQQAQKLMKAGYIVKLVTSSFILVLFPVQFRIEGIIHNNRILILPSEKQKFKYVGFLAYELVSRRWYYCTFEQFRIRHPHIDTSHTMGFNGNINFICGRICLGDIDVRKPSPTINPRQYFDEEVMKIVNGLKLVNLDSAYGNSVTAWLRQYFDRHQSEATRMIDAVREWSV